MRELVAIFGGSFALALSGALMPGPLLTVTVSESTRIGAKAGPLLITGHGALELLLVLALILGLGPLLKAPMVMGIVALVGGGMLIWMGVAMLRSSGEASLNSQQNNAPTKQARHPLFVGVVTSLANPYWTLWWVTVGLGYLVVAMKHGVAGIGAFFIGHITADYAWYAVVSLGVSKGKQLLKDKGYRFIIRACGLILVGFGGFFILCAKGYLSSARI